MRPNDTQTRIRRLFRKRRKQAEKLGAQAEDHLERNFVRKFSRLYAVRRFVGVWILLVVFLIGSVVVQTRALGGYYQELRPVAGGIYREGVIGNYTNVNPLYVAGQANDAVSKLIFASLFKHDRQNVLVGDLAQRVDVDGPGTTYIVKLKPNLTWHDGKPLTAADVVFTYKTIQNPDAQSPLNFSWQGVEVSSTDARTVVFKLPNPLASFPQSLTTGIIPQHALAKVDAANMRSVPFNTIRPIGSGPYQMKTVEVTGNSPTTRQEEIEMVPFDGYHSGRPAITNFVVHTYPDAPSMTADFQNRNINAMVGLQELPPSLAEDSSVQTISMPLTAANMVFFKTTAGPLADKAVRQALVGSVDVDKVTKDLPKPVLPVRSPVLPGTPGYDPAYVQQFTGAEKANALLEQQGWLRQANGIRAKGGQVLAFKLYAQDTKEYKQVTSNLREQWRKVGADVQVYSQDDAELRTTVSGIGGDGGHNYDALLYGISLGVDPDSFVYWHSSQADIRSASRLNLSEYKSSVADSSLEEGRTRSDPVLRTVKYRPFLQAWRDDAPALGLYQPRFLYITRGHVGGLEERTITTDTDRFNNVHDWMVRKVPQNIEQ